MAALYGGAAVVNSAAALASNVSLGVPVRGPLVCRNLHEQQQQQEQQRRGKVGSKLLNNRRALCTGCQCLLYNYQNTVTKRTSTTSSAVRMATSMGGGVSSHCRLRISFRRGARRRSLLGKGLDDFGAKNCGSSTPKCMWVRSAHVSVEELSVRSVLGDDEKNESGSSDSDEPSISRRPSSVKTAQKEDDPMPALKPSPRPPVVKLKLKGGGGGGNSAAAAGTPPPPPRQRINGDLLPQGNGANGDRTASARISLRSRDDAQTDGGNAVTPSGSSNVDDAADPVQSLGQILKNVEEMDKSNPPQAAAGTPPAAAGSVAGTSAREPSFAPPPNRAAAAAAAASKGRYAPPPRQKSTTQWRPSDPTSGGPTAAQLESRRTAGGGGGASGGVAGPGAGGAARDVIQSFKPDAAFRAQARTPQASPRPKSGTGENGENNSSPPARKGPILRDVGITTRRPGAAAPAASAGGASASAGGTAAAAAPKFGKNAPAKGKEDWRKKQQAPGISDGARRRVAARERDDSAVDLDTPVAGGAKGLPRARARKQTKASRKAVKMEAARAAAPVKVEILEVGKEGMSVGDLAANLAVNDGEVVRTLFMKGIATMVNQTLDEETVRLVCKEFEVEVVEAGSVRVEDLAKKKTEFLDEEDLEYLEVRPPVVTIMGHVDHGKTSLLDHIRKTKVAAGEAGGITQAIGAYRVPVQVGDDQQECVFLDTPGHQAFSAMRARGARVTDIAVIVVAADDGVRPQTLEAIAHAKAADVPFVVAINKIDKVGAQAERVMQELSSHGVTVEDWGGDVPVAQVSAKAGTGVDSMLETIMLLAELQELRANPTRKAKGTVIEARLDKYRGTVATLLVQNGTLRKGDVVLCGESYGKVRAMTDDTGATVDEAGPSTAVQVTGLGNVPVAGDEFNIEDTIDEARNKATERAVALREQRLTAQAGEGKVSLASLGNALAAGDPASSEHHQLNIVLKVDVQGTVEAIREALLELPQETVGLRFLMQSVGEVSASDIDLATASNAVVIAFNVGIAASIQSLAEKQGIEVRSYDVIYELLDDMRKAMEGLLDIVQEEVPLGQAEVRAVFGSGSTRVAGCMVNEGKLVKGCGLRVTRGGTPVFTGALDSLRRVKELAKEVVAGLECGVGVEDFTEWQEGDVIEAFDKVEKRRSLEEAASGSSSGGGNSQGQEKR